MAGVLHHFETKVDSFSQNQNRDVLNAVFTQIIQRVEKDQKFNVELIKLLPELLKNKNIQVSFSDSSIQKVFSANGYGGDYTDKRLSTPKKINDYLYINEANIGVNKVNSKIAREIKYRAMLGPDSLTSQASLVLTNSSEDDDYLVYLTYAVPKGSSLRQISFNNVRQKIVSAVTDPAVFENTAFQAPDGIEVEQYTKDNNTYIAFVGKTLKGTTTSFMIEYVNSATRSLSTLTTYSLLHIKQPGIKPYNFSTVFDYPEEYTPNNSEADTYGKNFLEKKTTINNDLLTEFELERKK